MTPPVNNTNNLQMQYVNQIPTTQPSNELQALANKLAVMGGYEGSDLFMAVLVLQIQNKQKAVRKLIKNIEYTSKMKEAIGKKIEKLRQLKTFIESKTENDNSADDYVTAGQMVKAVCGENAEANNANIAKACDYFGVVESEFIQNPKTGKVTEVYGEDPNTPLTDANLSKGKKLSALGAGSKFRPSLIDEKIQALTDKQQQYGNTLEIDMIKLNDLLAKVSQAVQLLSSANKSVNDRRMGVIQKF